MGKAQESAASSQGRSAQEANDVSGGKKKNCNRPEGALGKASREQGILADASASICC